MAKSKNDEIADALARMTAGEQTSDSPAGPASSPRIAPSNLPRSTESPLPSPRPSAGGPRPMATPQPHSSPSPNPPPQPFPRPIPTPQLHSPSPAATQHSRPLPSSPVAAGSAHSVVSLKRRPASSSSIRATLTPPLLVLGLLLLLTSGVAKLAGERLVIGTLPGWVLGVALTGGLVLVGAAMVNVRQLRHEMAETGRT